MNNVYFDMEILNWRAFQWINYSHQILKVVDHLKIEEENNKTYLLISYIAFNGNPIFLFVFRHMECIKMCQSLSARCNLWMKPVQALNIIDIKYYAL